MKNIRIAAIFAISLILILVISSCAKSASPTAALSSSSSHAVMPIGTQSQSATGGPSTPATSETPGTGTPPTEVITQTATPVPCAPATTGALDNIDPRGQKLTWWHQQSGAKGDALKSLVSEFNGSNDCKITVDAQYQGSYNDLRDKMNSAIETGALPGLTSGYQNDEAAYASVGALADINPYMTDPYWGLSASDLTDFYPEFLSQGVQPASNNMRLGFPPNRSAEVLYYNLTWLKELGFNGPPTSPEEFKTMSCAAAASKGDGSGGFILSSDASSIAAWTYAFGGDVLSSDGLNYVYNGQATKDALTYLKGVLDAGCAYQTDKFPDAAFAARQAIFTQGSSSDLSFYTKGMADAATQNNRSADEWGVTAIPFTTVNSFTDVYGGDVMIPATTPETQLAAWIFIKWFTQPDVMARWDEASGYFPTRRSAAEFMTAYIASNVPYQQGIALLQSSKYEPQLVSYQQVRDLVQQAFDQIMQGSDITTTLNNLTQQANGLQAQHLQSP